MTSKEPVTPVNEPDNVQGIARMQSRTGRGISIRQAPEAASLYKKQLKESVKDEHMIHLPRGGTVVQTCAGDIQFGIPPETIKDSMKLGLSVPTYFVILGEMFDRQAGVNMAEFEFPAYFNFFCLKKRVTLICMPDLEARVRAIFNETLLGPDDANIIGANDHGGDCDETAYPKFREEGYYLDSMRRDLNVDTLIQFKTFDAKNEVNIEDKIKIKFMAETKTYRVIDTTNKNKDIAKIDEKFTYLKHNARKLEEGGVVEEGVEEAAAVDDTRRPFEVPKFGITILGSSHGFDPNGATTGLVIWVNGNGIMVDPPPGSSMALEKLSIPPRLIKGIILTHCHADHDAGTFQKILKEQQVKLFTTETIFKSFMRKYSAISGFGPDFLTQLFVFCPVKIGVPMEFGGAKFNFYYSFHTIPCVGFEVELEGESMCYSADTNSDPVVIEKMFAEGAIGQQRRDMLINKSPLRGDHSLIFHEAGVPPIHTPMNLLVDLPEEIKAKLFVVHVNGKQIPADSGLKQGNDFDTLCIDMDRDPSAENIKGQNLSAFSRLLSTIDILPTFYGDSVPALAQAAVRKSYEAGTVLCEVGADVDKFTIFTAGQADEVAASSDGSKVVNRQYKVGDYTGETAFVEDAAKTLFAITAVTNVHTLEIPMSVLKGYMTMSTPISSSSQVVNPTGLKQAVLNRLKAMELSTITRGDVMRAQIAASMDDVKAYAALQSDGTWAALSQNLVMKEFTNVQRKDFVHLLEAPESFECGQSVDIQSCGILIIEGEAQVLLDPSSVEDEDDLSTYRGNNNRMDFIDMQVKVGGYLCDMNSVLNEKITYVTCEALTDLKVRRLGRGGLIQFLTRNPGLMVQLLDTRVLTLDAVE